MPGDATPGDASVAEAGSVDASSTDTPPADAPVGDAPVGDAPVADAPVGDTSPGDLPAEAAPGDASDARPQDLPCGSLGISCAPFACDVARGMCKTFCATNDDCDSRHTCHPGGLCSVEPSPCGADVECASGHCAQGACCDTACPETCKSCAVLGKIGTCSFVPAGANPVPTNGCPASNLCDVIGNCVSSCSVDSDCPGQSECDNNRCVPCVATCVSSLDCDVGAVCVYRNVCTSCEVRDASAGQG
jgi:hypothetical protein